MWQFPGHALKEKIYPLSSFPLPVDWDADVVHLGKCSLRQYLRVVSTTAQKEFPNSPTDPVLFLFRLL